MSDVPFPWGVSFDTYKACLQTKFEGLDDFLIDVSHIPSQSTWQGYYYFPYSTLLNKYIFISPYDNIKKMAL